MTETAFPRPSRFPWLLPGAIFVVTVGALVGVILLAREAGKSEAPPKPDAFVAPAPQSYIAYDVAGGTGGRLTLSTGNADDVDAITLELAPGTRVWRMDEATAAEVEAPLVVNVIAIPNEVRNYTIRMVVFAPPRGAVSFESPFLALVDGFVGHETSRDPRERVVSSALLESFDGRDGVTATATGPGTLYVDEGAPIRLVRPIEPSEIQPGDRIALHKDANGNPDVSAGVLVLAGGAR